MTRPSTPEERRRICHGCGVAFYAAKRSSVRKFCGHACVARHYGTQHMAAPGPVAKMANTLRDRGRGLGYRKRGRRHEHLGVAEASVGRALLPGEIVFHRDRNRRNNSPENLQVFPTRAEFARFFFATIRGK